MVFKNISDANKVQLEYAVKHGIDLLHVACTSYHCAKCSAYANRVYSLTGSNDAYPEIPDYVLNYSSHCGMIFYPEISPECIIITNPYTMERMRDNDAIKYSNRPFEDSRPQKWIDGYYNWLNIMHQKAINEANREQSANEYRQIVDKLPDLAPKSQGSYTRMKKACTDGYKRLKIAAESAGIVIKELTK